MFPRTRITRVMWQVVASARGSWVRGDIADWLCVELSRSEPDDIRTNCTADVVRRSRRWGLVASVDGPPVSKRWGKNPLYRELRWKAEGLDRIVSNQGHKILFILHHTRDQFLRDLRAARKKAAQAECEE